MVEKNETIKIDLKDRKLLYELDRNARQSNSEIGKKIRLNKNTINYKIKKLEENKVILGYYTVIDNSKLGYFSFRSYLKFFNTTIEKEEEIINWLKNDQRVGVLARIETVYDFVLMIWVKDVYEFDKFWFEFKKRFRKYIWDEKVDVFPSVYTFKRKYLFEDKTIEPYEFIGENIKAEYDELDMKILRLLSKNARMPIIEMSKKLKTPERTVAFRIKKLEQKKVIQGYRVNINISKIGYEYFKVNIILNDFEDYEKLFGFAYAHPNIIYYDKTLSDYDFEIDVEIENSKKLLELLAEIKSNFQIRTIEILSFKEYYKLELVPG